MSEYLNIGLDITGLLDNSPTHGKGPALIMCRGIKYMPVRHGHWIYIDKVRPECPDDNECYYECSECHAGDAHNKILQVPYCWHCGARMDGESDE